MKSKRRTIIDWAGKILIIVLALVASSATAKKLSQDDLANAINKGVQHMHVIVRLQQGSDQPLNYDQKSVGTSLRNKSRLVTQNNMSGAQLTIGQVAKKDDRIRLIMQQLSKLNQIGEGESFASRPVAVSRYDKDVLALTMTISELRLILGSSEVDVYENKILKPSLGSSVPVVFPGQTSAGFNGSGRAVALLDFGVSPNHSFLSGRLRRNMSACFSNRGMSSAGQANALTESLCISEAASSIGSSSGDNCSPNIFGCEHGTMMAGIIAGSNTVQAGVATGAQLISVQVGTRINDETVCGDFSITPCVGAFSFDIQEALSYVSDIAPGQGVAAVNISLATEATLQGRCDDDPLKPAVDLLAAFNVAVIASSGNSSSANSMASPACISNVIAVAATNNNDVPLAINNRSSELDLYAPGFAINTASLPANTFADVTGTSAAAAHVSGAWAVLKEKIPTANVNQIFNALANTGVPIEQGLLSRPRIRIGNALNALQIPEVSEELCFAISLENGKASVVCL